MDSDKNNNFEDIYRPEDYEFRIYCDVCDKTCKKRFYENHPKSKTHTNNNRRKILHKKI